MARMPPRLTIFIFLEKIVDTGQHGDMILRSLIPKSPLFFDLFERHIALTRRAALLLQAGDLLKIKQLEHEADRVTQECVEAIHRTFITPIDRDQIYKLISHLDDILDGIDKTADCLILYKVHQPSPYIDQLANLLVEAIKTVEQAVVALRSLSNAEAIRAACSVIRRYEHEADTVLYQALGLLFDEEQDARMIIKMKDIYESLEAATDSCADVADDIETILIENN